jgi:hypothetical protein
MGTDQKCGCRSSFGSFFLCNFHKHMIYSDIIKIDTDDNYKKYVSKKNEELKKLWGKQEW